jgi:hypothetical protein
LELCERGVHADVALLLEAAAGEPTLSDMGFVALTVSMSALGLLVGGLARFALPGTPRLSLGWTSAVGVAGTVFGALIGEALFGTPGGLLLAVVVSMLILGAYRRIQGYRADRTSA